MIGYQSPHPLAWKKRGPLLPALRFLSVDKGQSLCAECVPASSTYPTGFRFLVFPSRPEQDALSNFMLRLPREIRSMIYDHLHHMFKAYSGAFVTSEQQPAQGDVYMFDTGAWYSVQNFRGEEVNSQSVLELDAAPWAHKNVPHLFNRTPARHLQCLHPQILDECIDDICLRAGKVRLSMRYQNHVIPQNYDQRLFASFAQHARDLTVSVAYNCIYSKPAHNKATTLGYNLEQDERLAVIDDLTRILEAGCKAKVLTLCFNFDVPFTGDCQLTVNDAWVREKVMTLARFGCDINLCIYNRCDEQYQVQASECPMWEHMFSYRSSYTQGIGWSQWTKHEMSVYEVAALEC